MLRRTFGLSLMALGISSQALVQLEDAAAESVRHDMLSTLPDPSAPADEWHYILQDLVVLNQSAEPSDVLRALLLQMRQISPALSAGRDRCQAELRQVAAILSAKTALTYSSLRNSVQAGRWWRTAHRLAAASPDPQTQVWVTAQESVLALFQVAPPLSSILADIAHAESLTSTSTYTPATADLFGAKARVLAVAGRAREAEQALRSLREVFTGLDSSVTKDRTFFYGWSSTRLHYTESFTYSHLGDVSAAAAAQDQALQLYPAMVRREPVKIELQRALCLAQVGSFQEAARHANQHLAILPASHHDLSISDQASQVLQALPPDYATDERRELQHYVESRSVLA